MSSDYRIFENMKYFLVLLSTVFILFETHLCPNVTGLTNNKTLEAVGNVEGKIVEGQYASSLVRSYVAYLGIKCVKKDNEEGNPKDYTCGSTIINQHFLLTAAHCLVTCHPYLGFIVIGVGSENKYKISYLGESFQLHWEYSEHAHKNDIAIIKTSQPLKLGNKVTRAIVVRQQPPERDAYVAGWGCTNHTHFAKLENWLKEAAVTILAQKQCLRLFERLNKGTLCATGIKGPLFGYTSYGDSGSGLVVNNSTIVGLVSYSKPSAKPATVYTNVSYFYDWILSTTRKMYCQPVKH